MSSVRIRAGALSALALLVVACGLTSAKDVSPGSGVDPAAAPVVISTQDPAAKETEAQDVQAADAAVAKKVSSIAAAGGNKFTHDVARLKKLPPLSAICGTRAPAPEKLRRIIGAANSVARNRQRVYARALAQRAPGVLAAGPDADLPKPTAGDASFSWVKAGYVSSVKDQGYCGDCWNFAGIGVLESMYAIRFGKVNLLELSEQQVLDHNTTSSGDSFNCCGGWWAFDYMMKGVVGRTSYNPYNLKAYCPSQAPPAPDGVPFTAAPAAPISGRAYRVDHYAYVEDSEGVADTTKIKQALCAHGPLITAVLADDAFGAYTDGLFTGTATSDADGNPINHAVIIVGWTTDGWIVKNSWGTDNFGKAGFIHMRFGSNNIGYGAAWCEPALSVAGP
jgi:C1A family cysteine protease